MWEPPDGRDAGRWAMLAGGVLLAGYGLRRGSWPGLALALVGGAAAYRSGRCGSRERVRRAIRAVGAGVTSGIYDQVAQAAKEERHPAGTLIDDVVDEASDDSFPCSDPPSWTAR